MSAVPRRACWLAAALLVLSACRERRAATALDEDCRATCAALACVQGQVDGGAERCEDHCVDKLRISREQGRACAEAFAEGLACLAALSCSDYGGWLAGEAELCPTARPRVAARCEQLFLEPHLLPP